MKVAVVGATRGMGRALARLMAERGDALCLLGRDAAELEASARDLLARGARGPVATARLDLAEPAGFAAALDAADRALATFDTLVVTAGDFAPQEALERDPARLERLLDVNFTATAVLCQQAAERLAGRGGGTVCAFSSVAGDRARRSNYLYGASKAGLSAFLEGLHLAYADRGVRVVCVRPGFVKTAMTAGLPVPPFAGEPDAVARVVLRAIDRGTPVVYAPPIWRWVMLAIRLLPEDRDRDRGACVRPTRGPGVWHRGGFRRGWRRKDGKPHVGPESRRGPPAEICFCTHSSARPVAQRCASSMPRARSVALFGGWAEDAWCRSAAACAGAGVRDLAGWRLPWAWRPCEAGWRAEVRSRIRRLAQRRAGSSWLRCTSTLRARVNRLYPPDGPAHKPRTPATPRLGPARFQI